MAKENKFIPMPDAQTQRLQTAAELPFSLHESIGLNVQRLQTLCQISGFRHLKIENQQDPKTSKAAGMIIGINGHNTALAGKASIDTVPTFTHECNPDTHNQRKRHQSRWHNLRIALNTEEMKQRMLLTKQDTRKAEIWAKELNKTLTQGIIRAGIKQLVTNLDKTDILISLLYYGSWVESLNESYSTLLLSFYTLWWNGWMAVLNQPERFEEGVGHRWSFFVGLELDRAAVLLGLTYTQKLAKEIS